MSPAANNAPSPEYSIAPGFIRCLAPFDLPALDAQADTVFALDAELRLAFLNREWFAFADANGGSPAIARDWGLGRCVLEACPPILRSFFEDAYSTAIRLGRVWEHDYECSSPGRYRLHRLTAYPLPDRAGLLVVHARIVSRPYEQYGPAFPALGYAAYRDEHGFVHQCSHCRKTKRIGSVDQWDWVPDLVSSPLDDTSHALCTACLDFYYPG